MSTESDLLRSLADAIDERDSIKSYFGDSVQQLDFRVEWDWGAGLAPYPTARRAVTKQLRAFWPEIVAAMFTDLDRRVLAARAELLAAQAAALEPKA